MAIQKMINIDRGFFTHIYVSLQGDQWERNIQTKKFTSQQISLRVNWHVLTWIADSFL